MLEEEPTPGGLVPVPAVRAGKFHTAHKLTREAVRGLLRAMAYGHWAYPVAWHYTDMGRLVAKAGTIPWEELSATYDRLFMEGLALLGTRRKHVNVLQHLMGFLKNHISSEDKQELLDLIEDYRQGLLPLSVPLTLLKHHPSCYPVPDWVHQQVYLHPYPKELILRKPDSAR